MGFVRKNISHKMPVKTISTDNGIRKSVFIKNLSYVQYFFVNLLSCAKIFEKYTKYPRWNIKKYTMLISIFVKLIWVIRISNYLNSEFLQWWKFRNSNFSTWMPWLILLFPITLEGTFQFYQFTTLSYFDAFL